jgi:putative transposase
MARLPRLALAGHVHHLQQCGNGGQRIVRDDADCLQWLAMLGECAQAERVAIHAYVLLPDGWQLLLTPQSAAGIPALMQALGRRYVRYFNDRHQRRGGLWEGRYRSTVIEAERYLLATMALMDGLPVQSGQVAQPGDYRWSSHAHYAGLQPCRLLKPHPLLWALGNTPFAREAAYVERVGAGVPVALQRELSAALAGWAMGSPAFLASIEQSGARRVVRRQAGRPPRAPVSPA